LTGPRPTPIIWGAPTAEERGPVIATATCVLPEVIEDGAQGLLGPPRDPGSLATLIARVLDDVVSTAADRLRTLRARET